MQLTLDADQQAVVDLFGDFCARECSSERVRRAELDGLDAALWRALVDIGAPGIGVPVDAGGQGGSFLHAALAAEQLGRRLAPVPFVESVVLARALASSPAASVLERVLGGHDIGTIALRPASDGRIALVPWGAVATVVATLDADRFVCLAPGAVSAVPSLGDDALADIAVGDARALAVLATGAIAARRHAHVLVEWKALTSAALVGLAAGALALAVDYVKERHQFGRPIGAFQALAHSLVDAATAVDGARLLAYEAAWSVDERAPDAAALASMAFTFAADTATATAARALHCHGGYGFMDDYDIQLYYRRAKSWSLVYQSVHRELVHLSGLLWPDR